MNGVFRAAALCCCFSLLKALGQAPPAPAKPKPGPSGAYQEAARIPARIVDFKAQPGSIQPGQAVTLIWTVENPSSTTIDHEIGSVLARGSRQIKPAATTTYTMTVR